MVFDTEPSVWLLRANRQGMSATDVADHPLLQSTEALVSQILFADAEIHTEASFPDASLRALDTTDSRGRLAAPGTPGRSDALLLSQAVCRATDGGEHSDGDADEEDEPVLESLEAFQEDRDAPAAGARSDAKLGPTPPNSNGGDAGPLALLPLNPRAPEPAALSEEFLLDELAALRPNDPRQRAAETIGGPILRARWDFPVTVAAWGCAHNYQLGTGQYMAQATPKIVAPLERLGETVCDLSCGADHCAAVDVAGRLFTWGLSDHGRLGLQTARDASVPTHVRALAQERVVRYTHAPHRVCCC